MLKEADLDEIGKLLHDLAQPVQIISGSTSLIDMTCNGQEYVPVDEIMELTKNIHASVDKMREIVDKTRRIRYAAKGKTPPSIPCVEHVRRSGSSN